MAVWRRGVAAVVVLAAVLIVAGSLAETGHADTPGPVQLVSIGTFASPTFVTAPPGDTSRVFVVEKGGKVQVVQGGVSSTFLDITSRIATGGQEQGLLSIAFDPNYATTGLLYADYTATPSGNLEIDEFHATGNAVDSAPRVVLTIPHADAANHNGGQLQFGPDGLLYIGTGDGGMENDVLHHAQDPTSLLAKILRIDPHQQGSQAYTVPASNPAPSGLRPGWAPEVYAMGLRNPWRFSFDPVTGRLLIGDVGGDTNEEVDDESPAGALGANFGWSCVEGSQPGPTASPTCLAPGTVATPPILWYPHTNGRCSITGGVVVRDSTLPAITGRYIYGDFCTGDLSAFAPPTADGGVATGDAPLGLNVPSLSSFGVDGVGHVYATSLNGPVYRLFQSGVSDAPPVPSFTVSPNPATTGMPVKLDASASSDPDGRVVSYAWEWTGDGKTDATGVTASATFTTTGMHTITLTVTDDGGDGRHGLERLWQWHEERIEGRVAEHDGVARRRYARAGRRLEAHRSRAAARAPRPGAEHDAGALDRERARHPGDGAPPPPAPVQGLEARLDRQCCTDDAAKRHPDDRRQAAIDAAGATDEDRADPCPGAHGRRRRHAPPRDRRARALAPQRVALTMTTSALSATRSPS
jgi:glucose/arabinose dehydrogenase